MKKLTAMKTDLRVPTVEDIDTVYSNISVEEDGFLNYDEYLIVLFKATQDNYGDS